MASDNRGLQEEIDLPATLSQLLLFTTEIIFPKSRGKASQISPLGAAAWQAQQRQGQNLSLQAV